MEKYIHITKEVREHLKKTYHVSGMTLWKALYYKSTSDLANRIRKDKICINFVRCIGLFVAAFGILCNIAGLELGNLWAFSDLGNILIVFFNVPIVYVGAKYVFRATRHYKKNDGTPFASEVIGRNDCVYWDEQAKKQ